VILDALERNAAAGVELLDPVGAASERRLQGRRRNVALAPGRIGAFPPVLRQHRKLPDDLRQLAIARTVERKGDLAFRGLLHLRDMTIVGGELRMMLLERLERKNDIVGGHRLAVVPFRLGAQPIGHRGKIRRMAHRLGEQAVFGRDLVHCLRHEALIDQVDAGRDRAFHAADDDVEVVERSEPAEAHSATLGRLRIDVVEMFEAGRILQVTEQR
jgi:hypothetical protein